MVVFFYFCPCMEILNECPACGANAKIEYLTCKDFGYSGSYFTINQCVSCKLLFTSPRPDASEIGAYYKSDDYVSHTNKSKGIINRLYPIVRNIAVNQKVRLIKKLIPKNSSVADLGAGNGYFVKAVLKAGFPIKGYEPSLEAIKLAKETFNTDLHPIETFYTTGNEEFNCITLWHVLEHIHTLQETLNHIKITLKKNGILIIAVPNPASKDAEYYKEFWAAYDVPRHLYHFTPEALEKLIGSFNFTLLDKKPMLFDSTYVSLLSERYKAKSSKAVQIYNALYRGIHSNMHAAIYTGNYSSLIYIFRKNS